jgi:hypothetical protein
MGESLFASASPYSVLEATYSSVFAEVNAVNNTKVVMTEAKCGIFAASAACTKTELDLLVMTTSGGVEIQG